MMRVRGLVLALPLVLLALSGCSEDGTPLGTGDVDAGDGGTDAAPADGAVVPLRFGDEPPEALATTLSFTVGPQDACVPASCALYAATGGEESFIKVIDLSAVLPVGMHAFLQLSATYDTDASDAVDAVGNWALQWYSPDLWVSGSSGADARGNATLSGYVTNHGPAPPEAILVVSEPDGGAQDVEVTVHARATPLADAVHRSHVVGVGLGGGAVPVTVEMAEGGVLYVRGPDDALVLNREVQNGTTVTLPADSPAGEYRFVVFDTDATTRFLVPEANLTSPLMRMLDTTAEDGAAHEVPPNGVLEWTVDVARPPYVFRVRFDGSDGRSPHLDGHLTVTSPDGQAVIDSDVYCRGCVYSIRSWGHTGSDALVAGTYTVTFDVTAAQGWTVYESVGLYGR